MSFPCYKDLIGGTEFMIELSDGLFVYENLFVAEEGFDIIAALVFDVGKQELHEGRGGGNFECDILVHVKLWFKVQGTRFKGQEARDTAKILQIFVRAICSGALATTYMTDYAQPVDEEQIWSVWEGNAPGQKMI